MLSNEIVWSKTLLSSYGYLERLCNGIDKLIEKTAVNSFYSFRNSFDENSILGITDNIVRLSNKKIDYINLKIIIEKALKKMSGVGRKIVILKFVSKLSSSEICSLLNISTSMLYKKMNRAFKRFYEELDKLGYGQEKLQVTYLEDNFIKSIYDLVKTKNYDMEEKVKVITNSSIYKDFDSGLFVKVF